MLTGVLSITGEESKNIYFTQNLVHKIIGILEEKARNPQYSLSL